MSSYQYLLSESQERMLFVVKEEKINQLIEKFNKWGLQANVIGEVIKSNEVIISHKKKIVAQILLLCLMILRLMFIMCLKIHLIIC